ncbi:hypothetical protein [Hyphomicrobium sp.]|uniref:hypothetical protein n=1 Tax=Hyphomicrobium sp. TaxID=82 RepID=UPI001DB76A6A|nr:hypothetical protein [Hyphomicrobium sp.]MBY0559505.1 hypothetical protein [Hyphomicrobium sp.]
MTVNSDDDFIRKVERAYQGEVYGEALYSGIADVMDDPARAEKWRVLTELEVVTKARMRDLVAKLGGDPRESEAFRQKGADHVHKYASMPWTDFMTVFSRELDPIIERYAALEERCAPEDVETLRFLTEHEVVTKTFCDLELAGRSDISIEPTRELIAKMRAA